MEIKENDVFNFTYNENYMKNNPYYYWCFDGQLIVKKDSNGKLYLKDTYSDSECKIFTLEKALKEGSLTFICNLNDVEPIDQYYVNYYSDEDVFNLSYQSGCHKAYYLRKGANRSIAKMKSVIENNISEAQDQIETEKQYIEHCKEKLEKVKNGDTNVFIN